MGEHGTQFNIATFLVPLLAASASSRVRGGWRVCGNQFWYLQEQAGAVPCRRTCTWSTGSRAPTRARHMADVGRAPAAPSRSGGEREVEEGLRRGARRLRRHARQGGSSHVRPGAPPRHARRVRWRVFRRVRGPRVRAGLRGRRRPRPVAQLGCWIRLRHLDGHPGLRVAMGPHGEASSTAEKAPTRERAARRPSVPEPTRPAPRSPARAELARHAARLSVVVGAAARAEGVKPWAVSSERARRSFRRNSSRQRPLPLPGRAAAIEAAGHGARPARARTIGSSSRPRVHGQRVAFTMIVEGARAQAPA